MKFLVAAGLMVVCAGGIGRLLWLLEGKPPLDRPAWWPTRRSIDHATAGSPTSSISADHHTVTSVRGSGGRLAAVGACAACCGIPVLLLAGIAVSGLVATVSLVGALVLLVGLVAWRLTRRRVGSDYHRSASRGTVGSCCEAADGDGTPGAELASSRHV